MENIYSTNKIIYHPELLCQLRSKIQPNPIQMHLMPTNTCNHNCSWCSYRVEHSKNTELFNDKESIPEDILTQTLSDFHHMGGRAVEVTGGGEPLTYKFKETLFKHLIGRGFDYSLITNGIVINEEFAKFIVESMIWARISIDAATPNTYARMRRTKPEDIYKAFKTMQWFRKYARNPEFKLGMGFVVSNENAHEIYDACLKAKEYGADNVRISAVFHPNSLYYFDDKTIEIGRELSAKAEELNDDKFHIYNIFPERIDNILSGKQDYKYCGTKDILCLVGADSKVYTCCTLAYNKLGLIGDLKEKSLQKIWNSEEKKDRFNKFDARLNCKCMCLYEKRNKEILALLQDPIHKNFI